MTPAQRSAMYGDSPNAPNRTSNVSQVQAEAKQKALEKEKVHQDAVNSDTVAIDFAHPAAPSPAGSSAPQTAVLGERDEMTPKSSSETLAASATEDAKPASTAGLLNAASQQPKAGGKNNPMAPYDFDSYQGQLYRVFEGTVLEGVVTNHIDGGLTGPISSVPVTVMEIDQNSTLLATSGQLNATGDGFTDTWLAG